MSSSIDRLFVLIAQFSHIVPILPISNLLKPFYLFY